MHLVQLLLPLTGKNGAPLPASHYAAVREELTARFGGLTAYSRAPAEGLWDDGGDRREHDEIIVYEVMADTLDREWWHRFRGDLERRFEQEELVIRAHAVERL